MGYKEILDELKKFRKNPRNFIRVEPISKKL